MTSKSKTLCVHCGTPPSEANPLRSIKYYVCDACSEAVRQHRPIQPAAVAAPRTAHSGSKTSKSAKAT